MQIRFACMALLLMAAPTMAQEAPSEVHCTFKVVCVNQEPCEKNPYGDVTFRKGDKPHKGELVFIGQTDPAYYDWDGTYLSAIRYPVHSAMVSLGVRVDGNAKMAMLNSESGLLRTFYGECKGMK